MGEYADDYWRREMNNQFGFDPGSMYGEDRKPKPKKQKHKCGVCGGKFVGLLDHQRDAHGMTPNVVVP